VSPTFVPTDSETRERNMSRPTRFVISAAVLAWAAGAAAGVPPKKTAEIVAKGRASYAVNCASCHGDRGLGDGVAAAALEPKPRNLVSGAFKQGAKPEQVFATLASGVQGTTMVPFAHLSEDERWALAYYVLELRGGKPARK
jgi:mono/diheme cytochrome c family protein